MVSASSFNFSSFSCCNSLEIFPLFIAMPRFRPQTRCVRCGRPVLQSKADKLDGLCGICHREDAAIPPDDVNIPHHLARRLVPMNENPLDYRKMAWRDGLDFLTHYIDKISERNELFEKWFPALLAVANQCLDNRPILPENWLSKVDRAKQQIYKTKISNAERPPPDRNKATICRMPLIAISVAQRLWPGKDEHTVILTPEEKSKWNEIYSHPKDTFWWFVNYWWSIDDSPNQKVSLGERITISNWDDNDVPEGNLPWLVHSGLQWGPLYGGSKTERWLWDGNNCKFVRITGGCQF